MSGIAAACLVVFAIKIWYSNSIQKIVKIPVLQLVRPWKSCPTLGTVSGGIVRWFINQVQVNLYIYIYHRETLASTFIGKVIKGNNESDAFKKIVQLKLKIVLMWWKYLHLCFFIESLATTKWFSALAGNPFIRNQKVGTKKAISLSQFMEFWDFV